MGVELDVVGLTLNLVSSNDKLCLPGVLLPFITGAVGSSVRPNTLWALLKGSVDVRLDDILGRGSCFQPSP